MQARFLSAVALLALPAMPAFADSRDDAPRQLTLGAETEAPRGYVEMCAHAAEWCAAPAPMAKPVVSADAPTVRGGSAFPMILSFNFRLPVAVIERAGAAAAVQAKLPFVATLAALPAAPATLAVAAADRADPTVALAAKADARALDLLGKVNRRVNGAVAQRRDSQIYGQGELWRRSGIGPGAVGDCEDIAIEKRLQLVAEGFPADKLAFAVVFRRDVGLHTILVARTGKGDVVLDSLDPYVSGWAKVRYSWISIQSMADPQRWFAPGRRGGA